MMRKNCLALLVCLFIGTAYGAPHDSQVQDVTDQEAFIQNTIYEIRTLGDAGFARELWKYMTNGNILSGTATTDPGTTRYNAGLNPSNANSWVSRIYSRTALEDLKNFRKPARSYMTSTLIRDSTETWNAAISRKIQARAEEVGSDLGAE